MKRALSFFVIYIASLLVCTALFAMLFMFSCNLTMFVTGLPSSFFSLHFFLTGALTCFPLVCILTHILFVLYLIRHPSNQIISLVLYVVLGALSWLVLIPTDMHLISRYESDVFSTRVEASSAGVFRKEENGIVYYSRIGDDGTADGLFIDTLGIQSQGENVIPFFNSSVKNETAFPYSDILIKNSLQPPAMAVYPLSVYNALLTASQYSNSLGFLAWLAFASIGLALLSIYALQFASSWKLANVSFVICAAFAIIFINYLYYMNMLPSVLKEVALKLSEFTGAKDPLIILINLIITVILAGFGIFMGIYRYGTSISDPEDEE